MNIIEGAEAEKHGVCSIGVRPEHISISNDDGMWRGTVGVSENLGSDTFFRVAIDGLSEPLSVRASGDVDLRRQDTICVTPDPVKLHKFDDQGLRVE